MVINRKLFAAGTLTVLALPVSAMESPDGELAEVIVTAQGREQRLQDVPVAVSVVSGADLERVNIKTLQDVTGRLGNVKITTGTLTNPINVRGIGSGNNSGFEQSVATFSDGVYRPRSRSTNAALLDIERVEVLKGPQTTYFGANAIAGALNITTRKPGNDFASNGSALYAFDDGEYNIEGGLTLPASDTLSFRLAARVSGMEGFMRLRDGSDKGPNEENVQGRVSARWSPNDLPSARTCASTSASPTPMTQYPSKFVGCPPGAPYPTPAPPPPGSAPSNCFLALNAGVTSFEDDLDYHSNAGDTWYDYSFYEGAWTNAFKAGAGTLTSITSYFHQVANNRTQLVPLDITPFTVRNYDALPSEVREQYHQAAQELRFEASAGERVDYMLGAYYAQARWRNTSGTGFFFIPFGAILSGPPFNGPPFNIVTNPDAGLHRPAADPHQRQDLFGLCRGDDQAHRPAEPGPGRPLLEDREDRQPLAHLRHVGQQRGRHLRAVPDAGQPDRRLHHPHLRQLRLQPAGPRQPHQHRPVQDHRQRLHALGGPAVRVLG